MVRTDMILGTPGILLGCFLSVVLDEIDQINLSFPVQIHL